MTLWIPGRFHAAPAVATMLLLATAAASAETPASRKGDEPMTSDPSATRPAHTNRLIHSTSPYLLQHAHNPVDWFPWGAEALEKAKKENKPIFLSIGYSACHWCHVMERESFENPEIAKVLNAHFVCIKVDREERPDLDDVYMTATMVYSQSGGWPMSVFLTPDQKPFFAGTYFPPDSRYGRPGFRDLLLRIHELWTTDEAKLTQSAQSLSDAIREVSTPASAEGTLGAEHVARAATSIAGAFDRALGGIPSGQTGNKFPPSMAMSLMLRQYRRGVDAGEPNRDLLQLVELTCDQMANGGIYDHLGGGIARYSTDVQWLVPHFEKMLYDQALVSGIYLEVYQVTGNSRYAEVAGDIFEYVIRDLQAPEGGFYSARDADSEGEEGRFYVWSRSEVMQLLGEEDGRLFCSYYDVSEAGNWEGSNILNIERELDTVAKLNSVTPEALRASLERSKQKLFAARELRVAPHRDDKVLTSWNGLMIASLARGGLILDEPRYTEAAAKAAGFILERMARDGRLLRAYRDGKAHIGGYLDDYAFFVAGLIDLYEATFDRRWLREAVRLNRQMIDHFEDRDSGAFFFTADDAEQLIVRTKDFRDGAIPAGNSVALMNLLRLGVILDSQELRDHADRAIQAVSGSLQTHGAERFMAAVDFREGPVREVVFAGKRDDPALRALVRTASRVYDPNRVLLLAEPGQEPAGEPTLPLLAGKVPVEGRATAYVCRDKTCRRPVATPEALREELTAR